MILDSKMMFLIRAALQSPDGLSIAEAMELLKASKRVIQYNMKKINSWMEANGLGYAYIRNGKCYMVCDHPAAIHQVADNEHTEFIPSPEERQILELLHIALSQNKETMEDWQSLFNVSKSTIFSDVRSLKEMLNAHGLELIYGNPEGYSICGDEFRLRCFLNTCIGKMSNNYVLNYWISLVDEIGENLFGISDGFREIIDRAVRVYEEAEKKDLVPNYLHYDSNVLILAAIRSKIGHAFVPKAKDRKLLDDSKEMQSIRKAFGWLRQSGIDLPDNEEYFVLINMLSISGFSREKTMDRQGDFVEMAERFAEKLEAQTGIPINEKELFVRNLAAHLEPMWYRLQYRIPVSNPLMSDIMNKQSAAVQITRECVAAMEKMTGKITDEELCYLSMYVAGEMNGSAEEIEIRHSEKIRVLIICGVGIATSAMVRSQMTDAFGDIFQYAFASAGKIHEMDLSEYDIIISTVHLTHMPENVVMTNLLLTEEIRQKILTLLNDYMFIPNKKICLKDILDIMHDDISESKKEDINIRLFKYFMSSEKEV